MEGVKARFLERPMKTWESYFTLTSRGPFQPHEVTFKKAKLLRKDKVTRGPKPALHLPSFTK